MAKLPEMLALVLLDDSGLDLEFSAERDNFAVFRVQVDGNLVLL